MIEVGGAAGLSDPCTNATERWRDLMSVARAYYTLFARRPLESVGD